MTEINIQRKSGSNVWWWILGIVALLIIGWLLFAYMNTDQRTVHWSDPGDSVAVIVSLGRYVA